MEPKTLRKHLPKTIAKKDAKKLRKTRKSEPFLSSSKSEIGPKRGKKTKKGKKKRPTVTPRGPKTLLGSHRGPPSAPLPPLGVPWTCPGSILEPF